jgi:hypothetical protein
MLQPIDPIFRYCHKIDCRGHDGEEERAKAKNGSTTIRSPRSSPINEQAPNDQSDGEYQQEGRVEDVTDRVGHVEDLLGAREGGEHEPRRSDGEGSEDEDDQSGLGPRWVEEGEELDVCDLMSVQDTIYGDECVQIVGRTLDKPLLSAWSKNHAASWAIVQLGGGTETAT